MSLCLRDSVNECKIVTMFYLFIYVYSLAYVCVCIYVYILSLGVHVHMCVYPCAGPCQL